MTLIERIELAKAEIRTDILCGVIPASVASFSELHDYVDANEYGGLCTDEFMNSFDSEDAMIEASNTLQDAVHDWLYRGRID